MARIQTLKPRIRMADTLRVTPLADAGDTRIRGRRLLAIRERQFRTQPFCERCLKMGIRRTFDELDHVVPLGMGGAEAASNRRPLCRECHVIITAEQFGRQVAGPAPGRKVGGGT
jgi:5-methylcytosine-specific restriction endonuclease McrA